MTDEAPARITVAIVDDHPLVRAGLRSVLEAAGDIHVVAEAADGDEVPAMVAEHSPAIVLMDLSMARIGGGLGRRLMDWAIGIAREHGADEIQLTVYSDNPEAQRFYHRFGFAKIADIEFSVGNHCDPEFLYALKL